MTAYVVNNGNGTPGTVTPIQTATNKALKAITVGGGGPCAIAITPDGKTAYVSCEGGVPAVVVPIDTATNKAGKAIEVRVLPR